MIYNSQIAKYYKSYRPALHDIILKDCFKATPKTAYNLALDIGCGVGQSSEALLLYCDHIIGIDSSSEMLQLTNHHNRITYQKSNLPQLSFADDSIDLITFAGSLFYCKSQGLVDECLRVLNDNGEIFIYDFNIHLDHIIESISHIKLESDYDHTIHFAGLNTSRLKAFYSKTLKQGLDIKISNLVHLLLSDLHFYAALNERKSSQTIEKYLIKILDNLYPNGIVRIDADLHYITYRFK